MSQSPLIFGDYLHREQWSSPLSSIELTVTPRDLVEQWGRCGMTADYVASFLAYHFDDVDCAMNVLSTVLNELVENSVKFSSDQHIPISLIATYSGTSVTLEATNVANDDQIKTFRTFIERLLGEDPEDFFMTQIERAVSDVSGSSGLGLITMKKDFLASLGVCLKRDQGADHHWVSVQLHMDAQQVGQG